jgi:hypothetical protein
MATGTAAPIELVWEDPIKPPPANRRSVYDEVIAQVKENPGHWARVRVMNGNAGAYAARKRLIGVLADDPSWQVKVGRTLSSTNDDERAIFLRYRTAEQLSEDGGGN